MCSFNIECVGVCICCESCMYRVWRVSVLSFMWSGVRRVELWLRVCWEWGVIGEQGVVGDGMGFSCKGVVLGGMGVKGGVMLWIK